MTDVEQSPEFIQKFEELKQKENPSFKELMEVVVSHKDCLSHILKSSKLKDAKLKVTVPGKKQKSDTGLKKTLQISCQFIKKYDKHCDDPSSTIGEYPRFVKTVNGEYKYICAGCLKSVNKQKLPIEDLRVDDSKFGNPSFVDKRVGFPELITEDLLAETKIKQDLKNIEKEKKKLEAAEKKKAGGDGKKSGKTTTDEKTDMDVEDEHTDESPDETPEESEDDVKDLKSKKFSKTDKVSAPVKDEKKETPLPKNKATTKAK